MESRACVDREGINISKAAVQLLLPNAFNIFVSNATNERSTSTTNASNAMQGFKVLTSVVDDG